MFDVSAVKRFGADISSYLHEGFLRPWFGIYAGIVGLYDLASGPMNWTEPSLDQYKYIALFALIVGPFVAFRSVTKKNVALVSAVDGEQPIVGPGLEFVRQRSRYTKPTPDQKYLENLGSESKKPPPHMAEIIVRTTTIARPHIRASCSEPVYAGIADYAKHDENVRVGGSLFHETQSVVVYRFGGHDIPPGTELRLCAGSPTPIKFIKVEVA